MGPHRVICGNALDGAVIGMLMQDRKARMVFADPPYNVPIDGHDGGSGKIKHREFAMAFPGDDIGGVHRLPDKSNGTAS